MTFSILCTRILTRRTNDDIEKLGDLYWRGYEETKEQIPALRAWLLNRE